MPFKSGEKWNGNVNGRPKRFTIQDYLTEKDVKGLVVTAKKLANAGKTDMIKFLLDHALGKAPQPMEHSGDMNLTVEINDYQNGKDNNKSSEETDRV